LTIGNNFKVSWDGTVTFSGGSFSGGSMSGVSSISATNFSVDKDGNLNIANGKFTVDKNGKLSATSIYIGGTELKTYEIAGTTYMSFGNAFFGGPFLGALGGYYQYGSVSDNVWGANPAVIYISTPLGEG
jgi:hypothetical protein